jgi:hypothetical protein
LVRTLLKYRQIQNKERAMDINQMIDSKMDVLITHIKKHKKGRVDDMQLMSLLDQCYTEIIPPVAKMFVRRGRFVSLLMERKMEILKRVNEGAVGILSIVK